MLYFTCLIFSNCALQNARYANLDKQFVCRVQLYVNNPNRAGRWHNVPKHFHLNLILRAIVDPDGNQAIFPTLCWMLISAPSKSAGTYSKTRF